MDGDASVRDDRNPEGQASGKREWVLMKGDSASAVNTCRGGKSTKISGGGGDDDKHDGGVTPERQIRGAEFPSEGLGSEENASVDDITRWEEDETKARLNAECPSFRGRAKNCEWKHPRCVRRRFTPLRTQTSYDIRLDGRRN